MLKKRENAALLVLLLIFTAAFATLFTAAEDAIPDVVFLDGSYTETGEETGEKGLGADYPFTALSEAYEWFKGKEGGTVVVSGRTEFGDYAAKTAVKQYDGTVVFTSTYGGVDYAKENGAKLVITKQFHQRGDVRYENITFVTRLNSFLHGNGHRMVFGEGVEVLKGTPEDMNRLVDGEYAESDQYLVIRGGAESAAVNGDTYIEINSGSFSAIHCATKAKDVTGDVNIVINGAENLPTVINLGNDIARTSDGTDIYGTIHGNINVTLGCGGVYRFRIAYIGEVGGSMNVAANCGSVFSIISKTAEPKLGLFAVYAEGNGRVSIDGTASFTAAADDGYVALCGAVGGGTRFFAKQAFTIAADTENVHFISRENKSAPGYVSAYPTSMPDKSDGVLTNVNELIEYRLKGSGEFLPITGNVVSGLAAGVYEVRYAAENGFPAGETAEVRISGKSGEYVYEEALKKRAERIDEIRSTESALKPDDYAVVFYVSPDGDDSADGLSPETAWKSLAKVSGVAKDKNYVKDITLVLFERGGLWRRERADAAALTLTEGVDYSAYTGNHGNAKPTIYGSPENGASPEKWTLFYSDEKSGAKIWQYATNLPDVGVIVFNEGEEYSVKEIPDYYDGEYFVRGTKKEIPFTVETCLDNDLEFFNEYTDGQTSVYVPKLTGSVLYLRCDRGNPGEVFDSIEFNTRVHIVQNASDTVSDNICIKYGGAHGFGGGASKNATFTNLEIGWIGGVVQMYEKSGSGDFGTVTRFGNGIEIWQNCDGFYIDNCYVYQCYDAGITHQGRGASVRGDGSYAESNAYMKDVKYTNNVLEYNVYNIEYFLSRLADEYVKYPYPMMSDIFYENNLMFYAGYGFGKQRPNPGLMTNIRTGSDNPATNFHINNNLFFDSVDYCTVTTCGKEEWAPEYYGNTFVQTRGRYLAKHGAHSSAAVFYDEYAGVSVKNILGDEIAECFCIEAAPELDAIYDGKKITVSGLLKSKEDRVALSVDGGETWLTDFDEDTAVFEPGDVTEICAYTLSRNTTSIKSKIADVGIKAEFEIDGDTLVVCNTTESTILLPSNVTGLANDDVSILGTPTLVCLSPNAKTLAALLGENNVNYLFYGDVNLDGSVDVKDLTGLIMTEAGGLEPGNSAAADVNCDGEVSLYDISLLMKYLAGGDVALGREYNPVTDFSDR